MPIKTSSSTPNSAVISREIHGLMTSKSTLSMSIFTLSASASLALALDELLGRFPNAAAPRLNGCLYVLMRLVA